MIGKVIRGDRVDGLLRYLYGPGDHEEHLNPRLVASWSGRESDPARTGEAGLRHLADLMNQPVWLRELSLGRPLKNPVWHFPVRAAPTDPILTDQQWNTIARRVVAAAGIAPAGDSGACRWIAVRHAEDHVHIVATLARSDGGRVDHHNDALRARAELLRIEQDFGLRSTAPADRTARRDPSRKEIRKAMRNGQQIPVRDVLEQTVRDTAIMAREEREFFALLEDKGLLVKQRTDTVGDVIGYAVAMPGDRDKAGQPIWYSGSKLARDLSLPKVRSRLRAYQEAARHRPPEPRPPGDDLQRKPAIQQIEQRAQAWEQAATAITQATQALPGADDSEADAILGSLSDALTAAAERAPAPLRDELKAAAHIFQRAAQVPHVKQDDALRTSRRQAADDLRFAVRGLAAAGRAFASGHDSAAVFLFTVAAIAATRAAYHWYRGRGWDAQADAAQDANARLRTALRLPTSSLSPSVPYDSAAARNPRMQQLARAALDGCNVDPDAVLTDQAWPALAAVLQQAENIGHPAAEVLTQVTEERSLDDARSPAATLTWRMQRWLTRNSTHTPTCSADVEDPAPDTSPTSRTAAEETDSQHVQPSPQADHATPEQNALGADNAESPDIQQPQARKTPLDLNQDTDTLAHYAHLLRTHSDQTADSVVSDPAWPVVVELLQEAEAAGHSAADVLAATPPSHPGDTAGKMAWRVRQHLTAAQQHTSLPAQDAATGDPEVRRGNRNRQGPGPSRGRRR